MFLTLNSCGDKYPSEECLLLLLYQTYGFSIEKFRAYVTPYFKETSTDISRLSDSRSDLRLVKTSGIDAWGTHEVLNTNKINLKYTSGVEFYQDSNKGLRDGVQVGAFPNGDSDYYGLYLHPSLLINKKLELVTGLRYDRLISKDQNRNFGETDNSAFSGKLYVNYFVDDNTLLFAGWGQGFNAPRLQDLYITDLHFPGNFFVPNPNLRPEKSNSIEVGGKKDWSLGKFGDLSFKANFFHTEATDFINRQVLPTTTVFINQDEVDLSGNELSLKYTKDAFDLELNYGQTRSRNKLTSEPLGDTAPDKYSLNMSYLLNKNLKISTSSIFVERQDRVPDFLEESPSFFVQNLFVSYEWKKTNFQLSARNLFDKNYTPFGSGVPSVGRNIRLSVVSHF